MSVSMKTCTPGRRMRVKTARNRHNNTADPQNNKKETKISTLFVLKHAYQESKRYIKKANNRVTRTQSQNIRTTNLIHPKGCQTDKTIHRGQRGKHNGLCQHGKLFSVSDLKQKKSTNPNFLKKNPKNSIGLEIGIN